jgi:hypothetical protein
VFYPSNYVLWTLLLCCVFQHVASIPVNAMQIAGQHLQCFCLFAVKLEIVADYFGMAWHMDSFQSRTQCPHDGLKEVPSVDHFEEVGKSLSADRERPVRLPEIIRPVLRQDKISHIHPRILRIQRSSRS